MDNTNNKDFDDLEPRVTPQPTIQRCITRPSVPEVSLILGKHSNTTEFLDTSTDAPEGEHETYANWKRDGLSSVIKPKLDSKNFDSVRVNQPFDHENIVMKSAISNEPTNTENRGKRLESEILFQPEEIRNIEIHKYCSASVARNNSIDNTRLQKCKYPSRDETCATTVRKNTSHRVPVKNGSHDAIKSILKTSLSDKKESMNSKPDCNVNSDLVVRRKRLLGPVPCQSPRCIENSEYSRSSAIPRCGHENETNYDHDTVRELLLLVQDQNKQIKSLQTQVERLLQTHEQNVAYKENHCLMTKKYCDKLSSSDHTSHINILAKNNVISTKNTCQPRETKIVSPHASDNSSDVRLRYQSDQLRNTIVEKKVSIGVMTSFEFSVHNNPFVPDTDSQINAVLRDCGKNMSECGETWRTSAHCSRNIAPGTLENINEDSESYPSSIWKQSSNNTQASSFDKHPSSHFTAVVSENRLCSENVIWGSSESESAESRSNAETSSTVFSHTSTCPPIAAPRNFPSSNVKNERPQLLKKLGTNVDIPETCAMHNEHKQESFDLYQANDGDNYERTTETVSSEYPYFGRKDCYPRHFDQLKLNKNSISTDNTKENSIVLSSSDLRVTDRSPPSPDPSIHVEMREYSSDDDNEKSNLTPPVGWTFYKNVVGQVNRILHTIPDTQDTNTNEKMNPFAYEKEHDGREEILDSVKLATLERLKMLGINYSEQSEFNGEHIQKRVTFDSSYYPRLDYQAAIPQSTTTIAESNTSMHMKALALKYLSDEQLADLAVQRHGNSAVTKHKMLNSMHGTNMSLATMNYLHRYCLASGTNTPHTEAKGHHGTIRQQKLKHVVMTKELLTQSMTQQHAFNNSIDNNAPDNILDITTLKQQPKLL